MKISRVHIISLLVLIFLVMADQLTKYLVRSSDAVFYCNPNLAFSISASGYIFVPLWIFFVSLIFIHVFRECHKNGRFVWAVFFPVLVLAGALSNFLDRLSYGCVIDFISFRFFPSFNLADIFITIGVFGIILIHFVENKKQ